MFIAQSGENINRWGVLQYYESLKNPTGAQAKADALLGLYNRETRTLDLKDVLGSPSIRAGSAVRVYLELGDMTVDRYLVAERVKHRFYDNQHLMDLTLIGGDFIA